jgi:membrane-associated phospholipid phosphatase
MKKEFFSSISRIVASIYTGENLLLQLLALLLTYAIVTSGFDWTYFISVRAPLLHSIFGYATVGGFIIPILIPIILLLVGAFHKDIRVSVYGWALGQAAFLGWLISSTYKAFTGRVQPNLHDLVTDGSRGFHFGFMEHGIFWGWPSSHTTVAFAVAFAFAVLTSKKHAFARYAAIILALYVGVGVSLSIHWFSEFVAGAIIGSVIGNAVGKEWKSFLS